MSPPMSACRFQNWYVLTRTGVIAREHEIGIVLQKQIGNVVQMHQPVERRRAEALLAAQFVAKQAGGFVHVVDELGVFGSGISDMMVNDDPVLLVQARLKGEVRDPGGLFAQVALFPEIVVIGLQRNGLAEKLFGQPLQQHARQQTVQVAFVRDDHFRLGQRRHGGGRLIQAGAQGERGISRNSFAGQKLLKSARFPAGCARLWKRRRSAFEN